MNNLAIAAIALMLSTISIQYAVADEINSRLENQSGRIGQGLNKKHRKNNDALMRADEKSYKIANEEQNMRTKHGGKLTKHDRAKLNHQLNNNSRNISNANH